MKTNITVILDRSGSMNSIAEDTKGGFDAFVKEQQGAEGEASLTLIQFDSEYEVVYKDKPIQDVPELDFKPRGMTALLDAIGRGINSTEVGSCKTCGRADRSLFVIITDGHENSSKEYSHTQINELINSRRKGDCEFLFLGANQDAIKAGESLGIGKDFSMNFASTKSGIRSAYGTLNSKVMDYRNNLSPEFNIEDRIKNNAEIDKQSNTCT